MILKTKKTTSTELRRTRGGARSPSTKAGASTEYYIGTSSLTLCGARRSPQDGPPPPSTVLPCKRTACKSPAFRNAASTTCSSGWSTTCLLGKISYQTSFSERRAPLLIVLARSTPELLFPERFLLVPVCQPHPFPEFFPSSKFRCNGSSPCGRMEDGVRNIPVSMDESLREVQVYMYY